MIETLKLMLEQLIPEVNHKEDTTYHMTIRKQAKQPLGPTEDKEFTKENDRPVILTFNMVTIDTRTNLPLSRRTTCRF